MCTSWPVQVHIQRIPVLKLQKTRPVFTDSHTTPILSFFFSLSHSKKSQIILISMHTKASRKNTTAFSLYSQPSGFYFASNISFHLTIYEVKKYRLKKSLNLHWQKFSFMSLYTGGFFQVFWRGDTDFSKSAGWTKWFFPSTPLVPCTLYQSTNLNALTTTARNRQIKKLP